jgi:hypothetical protein
MLNSETILIRPAMLAAAECGSAIAGEYRDEEIGLSLAEDHKDGVNHCTRLI